MVCSFARARVPHGLGVTAPRRLAMAAGAALLGLSASGAAEAMTIVPIYDSSITSQRNAATIEAAFKTVANEFDKAFATNVTVKIGVSWGKVDGAALPGGDVASSRMPLLSGFTYSDVTNLFRKDGLDNRADASMVTLAAHLPAASPAGSRGYAIPYAEAQAVGYLPATIAPDSGYVGFSSSAIWDYSPANGISAGSYDFEGAAAHEISEVLGRITGLYTTSPIYATPLDVLRYSAPRVSSFSYSQPAYFSINGGLTSLGAFNVSGGGDRTDWKSITGDAQDAFLSSGVDYALSAADKTVLNVLGWGAAAPTVTIGSVNPGAVVGSGAGMGVPEPMTWWLLLSGLGLAGGAVRARSRARSPSGPVARG